MKRSNQILIAAVAVIAVCSFAIISCNKESKVKETRPTAEKLATDVSILAADSSCLTNTGSISSTGTPGSYSSWTQTSVTLGSGTDAATIRFEGTLGSFIRATSADTYIGTILEDSSCYSWANMIANVQIVNSFTGTAPSGTGLNGPCNKAGAIGTVPGPLGSDNFGAGYYTYNVTTHNFDVTRAVVVYKKTVLNATNCTVVTPDATVDAVYIVWVSTIISNTNGTAGTVKYRWYRRV